MCGYPKIGSGTRNFGFFASSWVKFGSSLGYLRKLLIQNCSCRPFLRSFGLHTKSDQQKSYKKDRNFGYPTQLSCNRTPLLAIIKTFGSFLKSIIKKISIMILGINIFQEVEAWHYIKYSIL